MEIKRHRRDERSMAGPALLALLCAASQCGGYTAHPTGGLGGSGGDNRGGSGVADAGAGITPAGGTGGRAPAGGAGGSLGVGGRPGGAMGGTSGGSPGGSGGSSGGSSSGSGGAPGPGPVVMDALIDGPNGAPYEYMAHHPLRLTVKGPMAAEDGMPNPFFDYRLQVVFTTPSGKTFDVPGYYAGDGKGGKAGDAWRVHFNPPEAGAYTYRVSFRRGPGAAIDLPTAGMPVAAVDGTAGKFNLQPTNKVAPDFRGTGRVAYVGKHILVTIGDGKHWIKTGTNSPEDFLGYYGFANTKDNVLRPAEFLHRFMPHAGDWKSGDPDWGNGAGKNIIGLINYLGQNSVNSVNMIMFTSHGDSGNVWPYLADGADKLRFDNAKLQQWEIMMSHADTKGVAIGAYLCELENCLEQGMGLTNERKLYYRELVARFAHHGGVLWNLGEQNQFTVAQNKQYADYIYATDPYKHTIARHTSFPTGNVARATIDYPPLMGHPSITASAIEGFPATAADDATLFRNMSAAASPPWVIMHNEQMLASQGLAQCPTPGGPSQPGGWACDAMRTQMLWPFFFKGGGGIEWYYGYATGCHDIQCEDQRSRAGMWAYHKALQAFMAALPLQDMEPSAVASVFLLQKKGEAYAVYLPNGGPVSVDLTGATGMFEQRWINPTNGMWSTARMVNGGAMVDLGTSPFPGDSAAILLKK